MDVRIIRYTDNMVDAIASSYAITRGLAYGEFQAKYYTLEKKRELITNCFESGHMSGFEFADIDFEILGCSRVFEVDKVRSRIASYEVEAGLFSEQRNFESVIPSDYDAETAEKRINIIRLQQERSVKEGQSQFIIPSAAQAVCQAPVGAGALHPAGDCLLIISCSRAVAGHIIERIRHS